MTNAAIKSVTIYGGLALAAASGRPAPTTRDSLFVGDGIDNLALQARRAADGGLHHHP